MRDTTTSLAVAITKRSSFQTYITIQLLVDKALINDCFKAYAYFRWLDDQVDVVCETKKQRLDFIYRQRKIIEEGYKEKKIDDSLPEEQMIIELIATDRQKESKLSSFILNFFAIIEFDAHRKGRTITQKEYEWYTTTLSMAVTDGIEHFINHDFTYPESPLHYMAGIGAHITHMLRDYHEDIPEGYINIPEEYLASYQIKPSHTESPEFKLWVQAQVEIAKKHFQDGRMYIELLPILRGKLAASWYCARFEQVLKEIEQDNFVLRKRYNRHGKISNYLHMIKVGLSVVSKHYL